MIGDGEMADKARILEGFVEYAKVADDTFLSCACIDVHFNGQSCRLDAITHAVDKRRIRRKQIRSVAYVSQDIAKAVGSVMPMGHIGVCFLSGDSDICLTRTPLFLS